MQYSSGSKNPDIQHSSVLSVIVRLSAGIYSSVCNRLNKTASTADKDQECKQLEEELRSLKSKLEKNEKDHQELQNDITLKTTELDNKEEELRDARYAVTHNWGAPAWASPTYT